ncbi:MAG: hypothetical protein AABW99_04405 [archaeon]
MDSNLKYPKIVYTSMGNATSRFEDLFLNADSLQIMYCLAEKNPDLAMKVIIDKTKLKEEIVTSLITQMISKQLVTYNQGLKGYTLTDIGLAALYNFHKQYVEEN